MAEIRTVVDDVDVRRAINEKTEALSSSSLARFFQTEVTPWFKNRAEDRFESEGDDVTGPWLPLAFPTQGVRQAMGYGARSPINERTGEMRDFVVNSNGEIRSTTFTSTLKWPDATPSGKLGTKLRTAQRGSKTANTPARPIIGLSQTDATHVTTELMAWVAAWGQHQLTVTP